MSGRMKKHRTNDDLDLSVSEREKKDISAEKFLKDAFGDLPEGSIYLSGLRHREGLTQNELGKLVGVAQYNISKIERGERTIGKNLAQKFAKVFKTDYRLFL